MLHRLVEVAVVEDDVSGGVGLSERNIIVEYEFERRVTYEIALHLDASVDGGVDDVARGVEEDVDLLVDVDEDLVLVVLAADRDRGGGGVDGVGAEEREVAQLLLEVDDGGGLLLDDLAGDEGLDVGGAGELRVPEVDDLVQDLVDEHEVLADGLLADHPAEVLYDHYYPVQQLQDIGGRNVEPRGRHHVDRRLLQVREVDALNVEDGLSVALGQLHATVEQLGSVLDEVRPEVTVYYGVPAGRQEKYLRNHLIIGERVDYKPGSRSSN